eukprot:gene17028-8536_t
MIWRMKDPQAVVTKWKDTTNVLLISSMSKQAIVYAWILEQYHPDAKKRGQKEFRIELFQSLVGTFSARKREAGQQPNATKRFDGNQHFVVKSEKRGYCKHGCGSKVFFKCTKCEMELL